MNDKIDTEGLPTGKGVGHIVDGKITAYPKFSVGDTGYTISFNYKELKPFIVKWEVLVVNISLGENLYEEFFECVNEEEYVDILDGGILLETEEDAHRKLKELEDNGTIAGMVEQAKNICPMCKGQKFILKMGQETPSPCPECQGTGTRSGIVTASSMAELGLDADGDILSRK